jgi:hypothetical protein
MVDGRDEGQAWERGWEGHQRAQARRLASLSLSEKLDWLESAQELARHLQARCRRPTKGDQHG